MSKPDFISENVAMRLLCACCDLSEDKARAALSLSTTRELDGVTYYPMDYIYRCADALDLVEVLS